jgi:Kef-type K+ transport system membrane component KefB
MFLVGLELNATRVRIRAHATVAISHASILAPFILGSLLPAFFAFAGMRTRIDLVSGTSAWTICALIVVVATAGKFGGTFIAARVAGLGSRQAASLGILMNTRGLMELIVLNTGLDLGVISPMLFTMMVLMALATTMATTPIVDLLVPGLVRYNRPA